MASMADELPIELPLSRSMEEDVTRSKKRKCCIWTLAILAVIGLAVGFGVGFTHGKGHENQNAAAAADFQSSAAETSQPTFMPTRRPTLRPTANPTAMVDSDGDGVRDDADAFPTDPSETVDSDGDGVGDNADAFPNDADETVDTDGDGVGDNADAFPIDATEFWDSDGDGVGDNADAFPNDASKQTPEEVPEEKEEGGAGADADAIEDASVPSISSTVFEYPGGEGVLITFKNPNPDPSNWIAIATVEAGEDGMLTEDEHDIYANWVYACGDKKCKVAAEEGQITIRVSDGQYRAYLIENDDGTPYMIKASSDIFIVAGSEMSIESSSRDV